MMWQSSPQWLMPKSGLGKKSAVPRSALFAAHGPTWTYDQLSTHHRHQTARIDDQQLRALFQRLCQAWTDGDAEAYGACFTADCDYVSFDGTRRTGAMA